MSELRISNALWLWSDTHFGHKNIVVFQQRPVTHDVIMMSHWIDRVRDGDQILHLGDITLGKDGNRKRWLKVLERMPGDKFLMLGNHDLDKKTGEPLEDYECFGFKLVEPFMYFGKLHPYPIAFTHFPISTTNPAPTPDGLFLGQEWEVNIHGHIHMNPLRPMDGFIDASKRYINLSVENTGFAPVQLGNVLSGRTYDTEFTYEDDVVFHTESDM